MSDFGQTEGDPCLRNGCDGVIELLPVEGCSCHIMPPCHACTAVREWCPKCGWEAYEEYATTINDFTVKYSNDKIVSYQPRPLDNSKIDYRVSSHTNASQVCEGVYPNGTTMDEVANIVRGTFGGRFEYFGNGTFKYIAYTD